MVHALLAGVYHGMELPYVFGTDWSYGASFTKAELELSERIQIAWSSMASVGDPGEGFPMFNTTDPRAAVLRASPGINAIETVDLSRCQLLWQIWNQTVQ